MFSAADFLIFTAKPEDNIGETYGIVIHMNHFLFVQLSEEYFEILSKTKVKSSLLILYNLISEEKFRYFLDLQYLECLPSNVPLFHRAIADRVFNKSAIFYVLLQSTHDVYRTETWLQGKLKQSQ